MLWEWGLDGLSQTAELLVSELVTNAVKATAGQDLPLPVRLRLSSDKDRLLIEVWDAHPGRLFLPGLEDDGTPSAAQEGGRGLFLVATLSHRWNWYAPPEWDGKVVWSELQLNAGHRRDQHGTDHLKKGASPAMSSPASHRNPACPPEAASEPAPVPDSAPAMALPRRPQPAGAAGATHWVLADPQILRRVKTALARP